MLARGPSCEELRRKYAVTVVIPTYNGVGDGLGELLQSLARQSVQPKEIVAVDSGSMDGTPELLAKAGARVLRIQKSEFRHDYARNLGAKVAEGNVLLFTVQDAMFEDGRWIENGLRHLDVFGGESYCTPQWPRKDGSLLSQYLATNFVYTLFGSGVNVVGNRVLGPWVYNLLGVRAFREAYVHIDDTNHLVRRDAFRRVGGFEGATCEDMTFGASLVRRGGVFIYSTLSYVRHGHDYRDLARYGRRVYVDNVAISRLLGEWRGIGGAVPGAWLIDALLLGGVVVLVLFRCLVNEYRRSGVGRVSFAAMMDGCEGTVHFSDIEAGMSRRIRAVFSEPFDSRLGDVDWLPAADLVEAWGFKFEGVVRERGWLGHREALWELGVSIEAHLFAALRLIEWRSATIVVDLEEFEHFGAGVIINSLMYVVSRAVGEGRDTRSENGKVIASWEWA
jgi:rhamnosyltransferase